VLIKGHRWRTFYWDSVYTLFGYYKTCAQSRTVKSDLTAVRCFATMDQEGIRLWLIGTVRAEPETVISRAWVQFPDPAK